MDPESMLKGRMAETLVEELFRSSGNTIYRFGYEAILQNLTQIEKSFDGYGETGNRIRAIPDFIAIDKQGKPSFIEVKFRWNGKLHSSDHERLSRIKDFWNAKIIFVNCSEKPFFRVSNPPYLDDKDNFETKPLMKEDTWTLDTQVYEKFEGLVEKYLGPTLIKRISETGN